MKGSKMSKYKRMQRINKEAEAEDWCFVCKDGGELIICDYGDCLKVYHPGCVGSDVSFFETRESWTCNCHSCLICHKSPKFHCLCCPNSVCKRCIDAAEFAPASGKNGFCCECLKLILLAEENIEYDSDGGKIDFKDRDTYEGLFKEYWEIIKEKEGLTLDDVYTAKAKMKGENSWSSSGSKMLGGDEKEDELIISDCDLDDMEEYKPLRKQRLPKVQDFIGWGSKPLIEFLKSLGKDITKRLSQYDVDCMIAEYIRENNLGDPANKKRVVCDEKLHSLFRKKSVFKNRIYKLLDTHFAENLVQLEEEFEDKDKSSLRDENENLEVSCKKQRTLSTDKKSPEVEVESFVQRTGYASIVANNINLVYLRRSLVEELLKHHESFEEKVNGSFVKVKTDTRDYLQKTSHQLLQVTGIKEASSSGKIHSEILLQASSVPADICISMLSDSDFTEEECEDLRQKVNSGLLRKPTVVELEDKARILHADITKHRIERELVALQNHIDWANEKGRRRELSQFLDLRELLKTPSEQERLLNQAPKVVAEVVELKADTRDLDADMEICPSSPQSILVWNPKTPTS